MNLLQDVGWYFKYGPAIRKAAPKAAAAFTQLIGDSDVQAGWQAVRGLLAELGMEAPALPATPEEFHQVMTDSGLGHLVQPTPSRPGPEGQSPAAI